MPRDPALPSMPPAPISGVLHIAKLAVGARDVEHLRTWQAARAEDAPPLRHQTRNFPKRAAEIEQGGSIYWVIGGAMLVRQRILRIIRDTWDDGSACAGLVLDPALVAVAARPVKAFQGWRYLAAADAPRDLVAGAGPPGEAALPPELAQALRALCLL